MKASSCSIKLNSLNCIEIYMLQKHCIRAGLISGQGQKGNEQSIKGLMSFYRVKLEIKCTKQSFC